MYQDLARDQQSRKIEKVAPMINGVLRVVPKSVANRLNEMEIRVGTRPQSC